MYVAAEHHQGFDGFGHEGRGLVDVREGVRPGSRGLGATAAGRIDLGLDDAGVAVVHGTEDRHGASVAAGVPDEKLTRSGTLRGRVRHVPRAAFWAACATVSLSAKPLILAASVPGRV
ncbi:MAG: hypothetical protein V7645_921 [Actinomycetota bacterium]|jgi:hypothetical protein